MRQPFIAVALACAACTTGPPDPQPQRAPASPELKLELGSDWSIVEQDRAHVILRHRDGNDGVRVTLAPSADGRLPGVSPILGGRTWEYREADRVRPAFAPPHADRPVAAAAIQAQGPDLLIRLSGPPLTALVDHPLAPEDPVLTWIRLRPRPGSWRIALQGLHVVTLAGPVTLRETGRQRMAISPWGVFTLHDSPPASQGGSSPTVWWLDTTPSAHATQPYPRISLTWTPLIP